MLSDWKYPVGGVVGAIGMLLIMMVIYEGIPWILDGRVDVVRREAAAGMVHVSELAAAQARADELRRQVEAGRKTNENFAAQLAVARRLNAEAEQKQEQEISDYEAKLVAAGRSCRLDAGDLDWLRKP